MSITIGDYIYDILGTSTNVSVRVKERLKTSYADIPSQITSDGVTYTVTSLTSCFSGCEDLITAPAIPSTVTRMVDTFSECTSLTTSPTIPANVTTMQYCFSGCTSLTTPPTILSTVLTDMEECFNGCTSLTTAPTIPDSVTDMNSCFWGCTSLTTPPNIPTNIINLSYCFYECTSLVTSPTMPSSLRYGNVSMNSCFWGCTSLTTAPNIPSGVTDMAHCFQGCTSLTTPPAIPSTIKDMTYCFAQCYQLTTPPTMPSSVSTQLKMQYCFSQCGLTTPPTIPSGTADISYCFAHCEDLTTAPTIPKSVTNVSNCFWGCESLTGDVTVKNNPTLYASVFEDTVEPIRIMPDYSTITSEGVATWTTVADRYNNVTIFLVSLTYQTLSAYRVASTQSTTPDEEGTYVMLEAVYTFVGAQGDTVTKTATRDGTTITPTWTETTTDGTTTVRAWVSQALSVQSTYSVTLSDDYSHSETRTLNVTKVEALLDFLDGSQGMGIAFGTPATQTGFECAMDAVFNNAARFKDSVIIDRLIGEIKMWAGLTIPIGWLLCDGSEVLIDDYPLLYAVIGNTWGVASDNDHFILPNFVGRMPLGASSINTTEWITITGENEYSSFILDSPTYARWGTGTTWYYKTLDAGEYFPTYTNMNTLFGGDPASGVAKCIQVALNVASNGGYSWWRPSINDMPSHNHNSRSLTGSSKAVFSSGQSAGGSGIVSHSVSSNRQYSTNGTSTNSWGVITVNATHTHDSQGGGRYISQMPPFAVVNYIICAV